jgi:hypothetical protein
VNDGFGMRSVRGDRDHGQQNADDAHQDADAPGIGVGGVFGSDFNFRHYERFLEGMKKFFVVS